MNDFDWNDQIADYVLGHMDDASRAAFEARLTSDSTLALRVRSLSARMNALNETAHAEEVPSDLWARIQTRLGTQDVASPANSNRPGGFGLGAGRALQQGLMAASVAVALGLGFAGGVMMQPAQPTPVVIAVLATDDMQPGAIIEAFGDDSILIIPLEALIAPQGNVLEVWTLPDVETGPVSLGIFERATELVLTGPSLPRPQQDQLYEITLEPEGGSPTGRPTGPILMKGFARSPVV